jgi:hypothetical protein
MARQWKNVKIQMGTIYEDDEKKIARIMVLDLESNLSYDKAITIEKTVERKNATGREVLSERLNTRNERVFIVKATEDELFTKESALTSKTIRNGILRCIPEHIISEAITQCRATMKAGVDSDPAGAVRKITDFFAKFRVLPKDLEEYLGHSLENISADEITDLQAVYNTIRDGEATWPEVMERRSAEEAEEKQAPEKGSFSDAIKPGDESTHQPVDKSIYDIETKRAEIKRLAKIAYPKSKKEFEDWLHAKFMTINVEELKDSDVEKVISILRDQVDSK